MFLGYYGLREQPFGVTPDPRFLYFGEVHREALASLVYGVEAGMGFTSLIAEPGTGKTTLLYYLLAHYRATARTAFIFDTQCNSRELLRDLLLEYEIGDGSEDAVGALNRLKEFLAVQARARRRVLLVLDEAQNLDDSVLETVRLLSNFETAGAKLLHIILSGQPQLAEKLSKPSLLNVRQRITIATRLRPFAPLDVVKYVAHRLNIGGYRGKPLFTPSALEAIARLSGGIPREINRLCFSAMSMGCAMERRMIDADILREVAHDFDFSTLMINAPAKKSFDLPPHGVLEQVFEETLARAQRELAADQAAPISKPANPAKPEVALPAIVKPASPIVTTPSVDALPQPPRPVTPHPATVSAKPAVAAPVRLAADRTASPPAPEKKKASPQPAGGTAPAKHATAAPTRSAVVGVVPAVAWTPTTRRPANMVPLQSWIVRDRQRHNQKPALIAAALALLAVAAVAIQLLPAPSAPQKQAVQPAVTATQPATNNTAATLQRHAKVLARPKPAVRNSNPLPASDSAPVEDPPPRERR